MARLARLYAPGVPHYVQVRPIAGRRLFEESGDYSLFVELLRDAAKTHGLGVHAYALLPGRVELIATPADAVGISRVLQAVGRRYVPHLNRRADVAGALWDRRYRSTLLDPSHVLLAAMRHVERVAQTEGLVAQAADWPWSSLAHHLGRHQETMVTDHAVYWSLSDAPFGRQAAYRDFMARAADADFERRLERSIARGWAFGGDAFVAHLGNAANRRATPAPRGRRRQSKEVSPLNGP